MILVDTDVLIAHLRGREASRGWMHRARREHGVLAVSVVTIAEITGGMRSNERSSVWSLLATLRPEPVTELVARRAGEFMRQYRRTHSGISVPDYLIAATTQQIGAHLATLKLRHYPMFPELTRPFEMRG
ncbi:MAG: VapC toxin family PIN domain ribonuclease [Actinomycetales bacterium]|nr:MAG: VapC toxin family PIN domain ribonuclease [Actinomycetales bacterium]